MKAKFYSKPKTALEVSLLKLLILFKVNHFYCPTNALNYTELRG